MQQSLDFLADIQPRTTRSMHGVVLGELFQMCSRNATWFAQEKTWLPPATLEVVSYLLSRSTPSPDINAAFYKTLSFVTPSNHADSVEAAELLANSTSKETFDLVLNATVLRPISYHEIWKVHNLIELGASQESIHLAFCVALYENRDEHYPIVNDFVQECIAAGLDINYKYGEFLRVAADCGQVGLLQDLLGATTNAKAKSVALSAAIIAGHEEHLLLSLMETIESRQQSTPVFQPHSEGHSPHLFECLRMYPASLMSAKRLIAMFCSIECTIECASPEEYGFGEESVTVAIWALYQVLLGVEGQVSAEVLGFLLENGQ
jgi:hypothetical protein